MKKALVIDGNSLIYRAFYATQKQVEYFKQHNYFPTNALKLVLLIILKLISENEFDYAMVAFDHHQKTFRSEQFSEYKAGRSKTPEELIIQIPEIIKAIEALGIKTISIPGLEADDLVGSFSHKLSNNDVQVEIYSSDKDMFQLIKKNVNVNFFKVGISETIKYTNDNFSSLFYGLSPRQIPDFKGIAGDSSDNLCGIKGIGVKTAIDLLLKYHSFEEIYNNISSLTPNQQKKFIDNKDHGQLCKNLATIKLDFFDNKNINEFIKKAIDKEKLTKIISDYHLKNFDRYL